MENFKELEIPEITGHRSQVTGHTFWVQNTNKPTFFNQNVIAIPMHCALNAGCISLLNAFPFIKSEIQSAFRAQCIGIPVTF